jgi:signal transduction histidine kinase
MTDLSSETPVPPPTDPDHAFAQAVLDALPSQIAVLDRQGVIVAVNRAWRRFAEDNGAAAAVREGIGLNYLSVCRQSSGADSDEAAMAAEGLQAVIGGARPLFTLEYPCHSPTEQRWFLLTASPLGTPDGGAVVAHIDTTARKLAQQQARERQQALARAARLHTVGALASALAHEITQPLTAMGHFNYAALTLLDGNPPDTEEVRGLLRETEGQVDRAGAIVQRLKDFIRHGTLRKEHSDVRVAVTDAVELVSHLALRKAVEVRVHCPERAAEAWIDRIQITQVVVNLLCNSIEAIEQAGTQTRRVEVRVSSDHDGIRLTVSDTGPGLDPAWGDRIFDVFETGKSTGAGIGLAVSRSIAEAHGGRLWAEPTPARGAVFHLSLPARPGRDGGAQ